MAGALIQLLKDGGARFISSACKLLRKSPLVVLPVAFILIYNVVSSHFERSIGLPAVSFTLAWVFFDPLPDWSKFLKSSWPIFLPFLIVAGLIASLLGILAMSVMIKTIMGRTSPICDAIEDITAKQVVALVIMQTLAVGAFLVLLIAGYLIGRCILSFGGGAFALAPVVLMLVPTPICIAINSMFLFCLVLTGSPLAAAGLVMQWIVSKKSWAVYQFYFIRMAVETALAGMTGFVSFQLGGGGTASVAIGIVLMVYPLVFLRYAALLIKARSLPEVAGAREIVGFGGLTQ